MTSPGWGGSSSGHVESRWARPPQSMQSITSSGFTLKARTGRPSWLSASSEGRLYEDAGGFDGDGAADQQDAPVDALVPAGLGPVAPRLDAHLAAVERHRTPVAQVERR